MSSLLGIDLGTGRLGEHTVGDDGEVILGPAVIVTPENVNSFAF
jgi:rhamnose transport system substrate-binding protein